MKKIIVMALMLTLLACAEEIGIKPEEYRKIRINEVFSEMITRDNADRVYSGKILSMEGLKAFEKKYGVKIDVSGMNFNDDMLIFGITDNISTRAFQLLNQKAMNKFTLDYADTGIMYKFAMPGEGKKHSFVQVFSLKRMESISHIWVKNIVPDGLSMKLDKADQNEGK